MSFFELLSEPRTSEKAIVVSVRMAAILCGKYGARILGVERKRYHRIYLTALPENWVQGTLAAGTGRTLQTRDSMGKSEHLRPRGVLWLVTRLPEDEGRLSVLISDQSVAVAYCGSG